MNKWAKKKSGGLYHLVLVAQGSWAIFTFSICSWYIYEWINIYIRFWLIVTQHEQNNLVQLGDCSSYKNIGTIYINTFSILL